MDFATSLLAVDAPLDAGTLTVSAGVSDFVSVGLPQAGYRFVFSFTYQVNTTLDRQKIGFLSAYAQAPAQAPATDGMPDPSSTWQVADGSFIVTADGTCPWAWQLSGNQTIDPENITGSVYIELQKGSAYDPANPNAPTTWTTVSSTTATGASATLTLSGYSCFCGCGAETRGALSADKNAFNFVTMTCSDTVSNPAYDPSRPPGPGYQPPPLIKRLNPRSGLLTATIQVTWTNDAPLVWSQTSDGQGHPYPVSDDSTSYGAFTTTVSDYAGINHSLSVPPGPPDDPDDTAAQSGFNQQSFNPLTPFSFPGLNAAPGGTMSISAS